MKMEAPKKDSQKASRNVRCNRKGTSNRSDYEGKNIKNMCMYFYRIKTDQEFLLFHFS